MKALACLALACAPAFAQSDKAQHLAVGVVIGSVATVASGNPWLGLVAGCAAGAAKELVDRNSKRTESWRDFGATCLGAGLGAAGTGWVLRRHGGQTVIAYNVAL